MLPEDLFLEDDGQNDHNILSPTNMIMQNNFDLQLNKKKKRK